MKLTGPAASLPDHEQRVVLLTALEHGVQVTFLAAIRLAENGGPGREFGVLSEDARTYERQAAICARSIRNNLFRYVTAHGGKWPTVDDRYTPGFVSYMGSRWAPERAENDPQGLNLNWAKNVQAAYFASGVVA